MVMVVLGDLIPGCVWGKGLKPKTKWVEMSGYGCLGKGCFRPSNTSTQTLVTARRCYCIKYNLIKSSIHGMALADPVWSMERR